MRILMINNVCGIKSTGRICTDLADELEKRGHTVRIAYGRGNVPEKYEHYAYKIGSNVDVYAHAISARMLDSTGFGSKNATRRFIRWIEDYNPDVIHLHILHGYYVNIEILFEYLMRAHKRIVWTLHDCWQFTGHCCYFDFVQCDKWKEQCYSCPQRQEYPASFFLDRAFVNYQKKKQLFSNFEDLTLVTPSKWLAQLVGQSILQKYPVYAIPNWIDLDAFSERSSDIRTRFCIVRKYIILGVASAWEKRKGLEVFFELHKIIGSDYQIVLVGLTEKQLKKVPKGIIGISHTSSKEELAELYSAADVFVNPTHEDNYPTTQVEAIACGTPVVAYDVGGCKESANLFGTVVPENNIQMLASAIRKVAEKELIYERPDLERINRSSFEKYFRIIEGNYD